jgi:murein L,D-transpeptidase YafK
MWIQLCSVIVGMASILRADSSKVDLIVIEKAKRTLTLMQNGSTFKTYQVALGAEPVGPKRRQGDHKTPEGEYIIDSRNPKSSNHLGCTFPTRALWIGRAQGRPESTRAAQS